MAKYYQLNLEIQENRNISPYHKILVLRDKKITEISQPGQFVTILTDGLLRRPFSISSVKKDKFEILYKVVGKGTQFLSKKVKGEFLDVMGPLGTSYKIQNGFPVFVCGGTGIASLRFLAQKLTSSGILFYGVKTKKEIIGLDVFIQKKWKIEIATEDGSFEYRGTVSELFKKYLNENQIDPQSIYIYSSGPKEMLKIVSEICKKNGLKGQISLEKIIACGVGACRGCVIKTKDGKYKTVCKDGPVFDLNDVLFPID